MTALNSANPFSLPSLSLMDAIQKKVEIPQCPPSQIHYPTTGADQLSKIEENHFWFTERRHIVYRLLARHLNLNSPIRGIDIGCGSGYTAVYLTEKGIPTFGLDAHSGFQKYQQKNRGSGFIQGDLFSINPLPEFDFVLLLDVIEHIEKDQSFIQHVSRLLKPGGVLIISVPAFQWLWSPVDDLSGHLRRYTKKDMGRFESPHLKSIQQSYFYGITLPLYFISRTWAKFKQVKNANLQAEQMPSPLVNTLMKVLLRMEMPLFFSLGVPIGSSLFSVFRREVEESA